MIISNELVFVELHKTACTHIGKLLISMFDGVRHGKHNPPPPVLLSSKRHFLGSVRNPWDWYVSLWSYGCDQKGLVYNLTTRPLSPEEQKAALPAIFLNASNPKSYMAARKPEQWRQCYSDVHSASAFRDWLFMMHDEDYWNDFGSGYSDSPMAKFVGLLTYRYISLFCSPLTSVTSFSDIATHDKKNCYINHFIRTEFLEKDFINSLQLCGININKEKKDLIYTAKKTNTSSHRDKTTHFYDNETKNLVLEKENLIINKFSYSEPDV